MSQLENIRLILGMGVSETTQNTLLSYFLDIAKQDILNRRFPFGTDNLELEPQYLPLQVELAVIKYSMRGVEGQSSHEENGITRTYHNTLINAVIPFGKVLWEVVNETNK